MEQRKLRIQFAKSGTGSTTTRITLPKTWMDKMDIDAEDRNVLVTYNEKTKKITIEKLEKENE